MGIQTASQAISNEAGGNSPYGFKNRLINGAMTFWQRGTSTSSLGGMIADRWYVSSGSSITATQSSDAPTGFKNSLSLSGTNYPQCYQRIESVNCVDLPGQTISISFWAKVTSGTGSVVLNLYTPDTTDTYTGATLIQQATFSNGGSTWTKYSTTWSNISSTITKGLQLLIYVDTTSSASFLVTGVQLEKGPTPTSFDWRPYSTELQLCQRYYEKTYLQSEVPGANVDTVNSASRTYSFGDSNTQSQPFVWNFKVSKRAAPTVNIYNPYNGTANQYRILESSANCPAQVIKNLSTETCTVASAGAGLSSNYRFDVHLTASAEI